MQGCGWPVPTNRPHKTPDAERDQRDVDQQESRSCSCETNAVRNRPGANLSQSRPPYSSAECAGLREYQ
jgi:hypothetical protein